MPTMANITVKKADGTTNVVYTAIKASSGNKDSAVWRCDTAATFAAGKPELVCVSKDAANGTQRVVTWKLVLPETYTDTTTGLVSVRYKDVASAVFTTDQRCPDTLHSELAAQFGNLLASVLGQSTNSSGYSPN